MVNDTVGTMMSCGYRDQSCEIGMIIGTGTNACYMDEIKNVKRVGGEDIRMCRGKIGLQKAQEILSELDLPAGPVDCQIVAHQTHTLSTRSAQLCTAALASIANRIRVNQRLDHLSTTVGVDGTVYKKHPNFSKQLQETVRILAPKCDITFLVSEDGSGKGHCHGTMVYTRIWTNQLNN
ncbi:hypothetical protein J4Q44_G00126000 [Coregonus suidteri]|uniref:Phosphotransferase n=1 Tax=Coregonus suidteri TaxID=861788 RepID=A0AAN8M2J2_9TELE